jgi:hypothetical protein
MDVNEREVHPAAAIFPMLPDDELAELAESIKTNGLLEPIVLDHDGRLVDGRNRLAACRIAEVEPTYTTLNGTDPVGYILALNVHRRHLTAGQRAVAVVMANLLDSSKQGQRDLAAHSRVSQQRVSQANVIVAYRPDLAEAILAGKGQFFDKAYDEAREEKQRQEGEAERLRREAQQLEKLRDDAPDLWTLVTEERQSLAEAWIVWKEREKEVLVHRRIVSEQFHSGASRLATAFGSDPHRLLREWLPGTYFPDTTEARAVKTSAGLRVLAECILGFADALDEVGGTLE